MADPEVKKFNPADLEPMDGSSTFGSIVNAGVKMGMQSVLPTAGGLLGGAAGGALGTIVPGVGNAAGAVAGASLGSMGGEYLNQQMGITDPSALSMGLAGAAPLVGPVSRMAIKSLPGASAGLQNFVTEQLGPRGANMLAEIRPPAPSGPLFQRLAATGAPVKVGTSSLFTATQGARSELAQVAESLRPNVSGLLDGAEELAGTQAGKFVDFNVFNANREAMGAKMHSIIAQGGEGAGIAKKLYGAMWDDLEQAAANTPGQLGKLMQDAVSARKAEEGVKLLEKILGSGMERYRVGNPENTVDGMLTQIGKNRALLRKFLPDGDVNGVIDALKPFAKMPMSGKGAQTGIQAIPAPQRILVGAALGATTGNAIGGPMGGAAGAGTILAIEGLSHFLSTAPGRYIIKSIAKNGATFDQIVAAMGQSAISASGIKGTPDMTGMPGLQLAPQTMQ